MANKAKRVRTGCLTCRQRHMKCDEAVPDCVNCRRSNRHCKRGLRLNFLDTMVFIPSCLAFSRDWAVNFLDESRHIASEYRGGLKRYAAVGQHGCASTQGRQRTMLQRPEALPLTVVPPAGAASSADEVQSVQHGLSLFTASDYRSQLGDTPQAWHGGEMDIQVDGESLRHPVRDEYNLSRASDVDATQHTCHVSDGFSDALLTSQAPTGTPTGHNRRAMAGPGRAELGHPGPVLAPGEPGFLETREEFDYMRAFVDGVGVWMDSLDHERHFSQVIPCHALESPLLLNALLACGAKHLALANPKLDRKAERYYNTATLHLIRSLQNRDRDAGHCTVSSVVLYVYEVMSDKPARDMNHIAGARALIRECGWDARSTGVGSACFWLSVGMEILCCLAMNWLTTWDPDEWGLDMDWTNTDGDGDGDDGDDSQLGQQVWVHRAFYIVAKVANFRASTPLYIDSDPHDQQARLGTRLAEWRELKRLCDNWNNRCPKSMHPVGYLQLQASKSESSFPKFWLTRNSALLGRLLYHTAQCILTQTNPMESSQLSGEMKALQLHHARQILGIIASNRDRRMLSVAVQAATVAAATLVDRREQMEAWSLLGSIQSQHGRHTSLVELRLMREWGWVKAEPPARVSGGGAGNDQGEAQADVSSEEPWAWPMQPSFPPAESLLEVKQATADMETNPLNSASFSHSARPYKQWYRPVGA